MNGRKSAIRKNTPIWKETQFRRSVQPGIASGNRNWAHRTIQSLAVQWPACSLPELTPNSELKSQEPSPKLLCFLTLSHGQWVLKMRLQWPCTMKLLESVTWGYFTLNFNRHAWWSTPEISALGGAEAGGSWIQGNLGYRVRPCLKTKAKIRAVRAGASGDPLGLELLGSVSKILSTYI